MMFCRYYGYMYSHWLSKELLNIVSQVQMCEDILFNFLVADVIRHPPIKLCQRPGSDWSKDQPADGQIAKKQLATRHQCLNQFVKQFGYMPLLTSEAQFDPLLYKSPVPFRQKKYRYMEVPANSKTKASQSKSKPR